MPHNLSIQIVCPSPKALNINEKGLHWASVVVRGTKCGDVMSKVKQMVLFHAFCELRNKGDKKFMRFDSKTF